MNTRRLLLIAALAGLLVAYFALDLGRFLSIDYFKSQQETIEAWRARSRSRRACCSSSPTWP
jgi:hypothetical protein